MATFTPTTTMTGREHPDTRPDTPIMILFRARCALLNQAAVYVVPAGLDEDKELETRFYAHTDRLADAIKALPPICAADITAKIIADTCDTSVFFSHPGAAACATTSFVRIAA